jgi:PIN domain nuclease of toxin-antitoxin system
MIAYLDTNVVVWLAQGAVTRFGPRVQQLLERADLLISPMVLIELEYLYEVHRIKLSSQDIHVKLQHEIGVRVCDLAFPSIASMATAEKWTRDPFDRVIVAHAKANGLASLISADQQIQKNYPRTIW